MSTTLFVLLFVVFSSGSALASPVWDILSSSNTSVPAGGQITYYVAVQNDGDVSTDGSQIKLAIDLPPELTVESATVIDGASFDCSSFVAGSSDAFACTDGDVLDPGTGPTVAVVAKVSPSAAGSPTTSFVISGGGAVGSSSTVDSTRISSSPSGFGVDSFDGQLAANAAGDPFTQAGGHPYAFSTQVLLNTVTDPVKGDVWPTEPAKDVIVDLPPGLVGNPASITKCTAGDLAGVSGVTFCPSSSQVGIVRLRFNGRPGIEFEPVFNMVAPPDVSARFGFSLLGTLITLDATLRSAGDYGVSVSVSDAPEPFGLVGTEVTFWGDPSDASHDTQRICTGLGTFGCSTESSAPLLRMPTSCTAPGVGLQTGLRVDSWYHPGDFKTASFVSHLLPSFPFAPIDWGSPQGTTGCDLVPFDASLSGSPANPARANQPAGFSFDVSIPQAAEDAIGQADLKKALVMLPAGVRVSPSSADGLGACSSAEIGLHSTAAATCPESSKIGTVTIDTPLLDDALTGSVYLATPHDNPFGSLLAVYIVADGPGVVLKTPGEVQADPQTGQLTAVFDDIPQLPFSNLHLQLKDGPRAPLVLPSQCGTHTTHTVLTGWNGKVVNSDSHFNVSEGSGGSACPSPSFAPGFTAGTTNPVAGAFSPFELQLKRSDADSEFNSLSLNLPRGLLADLGSVPVRCSDVQSAAAACPADSHIGEVTIGAGAGSNPFYVGGDLYLTGPYKGGPFGLAVVVRAQAGPFDLGNVVVRAAVQVHDDGSVTASTDPFPTILQGIPLQVRDIRVNIDRPHFILNPTNCSVMSVGGSVSSTDGQSAGLNSRFQVGECAALGFRPSFRVSTGARTSKAQGASLDVKVASGEGQANLAKTVVTLPKQLPARLTTIQKACPQETFAANPATCPVASAIGIATARTSILANPVTGPAYLVSHGGAAFPDVVLILQGEGVTVNVVGGVNIRKSVTTATFNRIPDVPIAVFELKLPTGPHSGLGSNLPVKARGSMCGQNLTMPTVLTGQNGAQIRQNTKIAVTGCPRAKKKHKATAMKKHTRGGKGHKK